MRTAFLILLGSACLSACTDPVVDQARIDARYVPVKADSMLAVAFAPGIGALDGSQANELRSMVVAGRSAQRDEFVVVTDGSGGGLQQVRAEQVRKSLVSAGARWVDATVEPAMTMGPDTVVVVRSEYRIAERNCPDRETGAMWNPNETPNRSYGCADAYNMGQMLARPRDAAIGRSPGPADATVMAAAIERYRDGKVRSAGSGGGSSPAVVINNGGGSAGGQ
jgi:type IV pilus biogenesis protein CpaD/CtpE